MKFSPNCSLMSGVEIRQRTALKGQGGGEGGGGGGGGQERARSVARSSA